MSTTKPMTGLRRRVMPGMPSASTTPAPAADAAPLPPSEPVAATPPRHPAPEEHGAVDASQAQPPDPRRRQAAADYSATRLVNFRLPVDLHDRYRKLVQEVEHSHPRLRRPSLTEVLIGLLEEGPMDVDEVAAVIRRKRAHEYAEEQS